MYNLFISHSWAYGDAYDRLVDLLNAKSYFSYKNYSVPKDDPIHDAPNTAGLERAIREQIEHAGCVLIMAGKYSTYSKWINHQEQEVLNCIPSAFEVDRCRGKH